MIALKRCEIISKGELTFYDITDEARSFLSEIRAKNGLLVVFVSGATGSVLIMEGTPRSIQRAREFLRKIVPDESGYRHPVNARSHLRAMLLGCSKVLVVRNGELELDPLERIFIAELDTPSRRRRVFHLLFVGSRISQS